MLTLDLVGEEYFNDINCYFTALCTPIDYDITLSLLSRILNDISL